MLGMTGGRSVPRVFINGNFVGGGAWHTHAYVTSCMCDLAHLHVWYDWFVCVTWLIRMCAITHSCVWHDSFVCVTWLMHTCDMTHSCVWHDAFIYECDTTRSFVIRYMPVNDGAACLRQRSTLLETVRDRLVYTWHDAYYMYLYTAKCDMTRSFVTWRIHMLALRVLIKSNFVFGVTWFICDTSYSYVWHDSCIWHGSFLCVTWIIHTCDMTYSYMRHDSCIYVTWRIHMCDMIHSYISHGRSSMHVWHDSTHVWHDVFRCDTWLIHTCHMDEACFICDMTFSYVWHDSFILLHVGTSWFYQRQLCGWRYGISLTCLIHMCDMTDSYLWHNSFICVTWLIQMCDMTHSDVWHVSFICVAWLIQMCDIAHSYVRHDSFMCVTWLMKMCDVTYSYLTWLIHM